MSPPPVDTSLTRKSSILIRGLELMTRIGVPESERAQPQKLLLDLDLFLDVDFAQTDDQIALTVDYASICKELQELAEKGSRHLMETLASELVDHLERWYPQILRCDVVIRKFILPGTEYVAVRYSVLLPKKSVRR
ncbi:MAG: dihydroneopterin aldolase [Chthoniobacterales bacterium]